MRQFADGALLCSPLRWHISLTSSRLIVQYYQTPHLLFIQDRGDRSKQNIRRRLSAAAFPFSLDSSLPFTSSPVCKWERHSLSRALGTVVVVVVVVLAGGKKAIIGAEPRHDLPGWWSFSHWPFFRFACLAIHNAAIWLLLLLLNLQWCFNCTTQPTHLSTECQHYAQISALLHCCHCRWLYRAVKKDHFIRLLFSHNPYLFSKNFQTAVTHFLVFFIRNSISSIFHIDCP